MKFCSECGAKLDYFIPEGDSRYRFVCLSCGKVHYQNPLIVTGTLPVYQDKILLCKRAIEPRYGFWTLPAGFMENDETTLEGALRETMEEAMANVKSKMLFSIIHLLPVNQVQFFYLADLEVPKFAPGIESLEVELFSEDEIPWQDLAFLPVIRTLEDFFNDRKSGNYQIHISDITNEDRKNFLKKHQLFGKN